ncbi:MAG: hypothetical protein GXP53_00495 [Deltaproteobacteria bacterium]|nr:hypothetical protein [Deltaproteobacteria bacterium]
MRKNFSPMRRPGVWPGLLFLLACLALILSGCASARLARARAEFYRGDTGQAASVLENADLVSNRDRLLFFMEKGLILHQAGEYKKSIQALRSAADLLGEQEVISIGHQGASLVTSESVVAYPGEYEERLLVHTYLMMNYLLSGRRDDALVEAKQSLEVISDHPSCKTDYFSRALIAHCYEALDEINDAYIEYKKLANDMPDPDAVMGRLYAMALFLGFYDEAQNWGQHLSAKEKKEAVKPAAGELILFISQGKGPIKKSVGFVAPKSIRFSIPEYRDRTKRYMNFNIMTANYSPDATAITTGLGTALRASLKARLKKIIAKETARVVAKEAIARKIDNPLAEILVRIAFFATEKADTRCWKTLPAYLTLVRVPLSQGSHRLSIRTAGGDIELPEITVIPGRHYYYAAARF